MVQRGRRAQWLRAQALLEAVQRSLHTLGPWSCTAMTSLWPSMGITESKYAGSACITVGGSGDRSTGELQLDSPRHATVDGNGKFVISDTNNNRIQLCTTASCTTVAGTGSSSSGLQELNLPCTVALDSVGDHVIADHANNRIMNCPAFSPMSDCFRMVVGLQEP